MTKNVSATVELREGVSAKVEQVRDCGFEDALRLLDKMDGLACSLISFEREDKAVLMVGGGPSQFVLSMLVGDESQTAIFENEGGGRVRVCAGGQIGEYSAEEVASRDQAEKVLYHFFTASEANVIWLKD